MSRAPRTGLPLWLRLAVLIVALCGASAALAEALTIPTVVRAADLPATKRTPQGLYVTAREAHAAVVSRRDVLLIDVRTPGETLFGGIAAPMTRNIPYLVIEDGHAYDAERRRYKLVANPDFPKAVTLLIAEKKLGPDPVLILYCAVGDRSAKAARLLGESGHRNVYNMVDGFEGDATAGPAAGAALPGWQGAGLPVTFEMSEDQAYHSPTM